MRLASIKLISGEEILAEIVEFNNEEEYSSLVIKNPVKIELNNSKRNLRKEYKLTSWMVFSNTEEHELSVINIIALTAILDEDVQEEYLNYLGKERLKETKKVLKRPSYKPMEESVEDPKEFTSEYGYLGSVKDFKKKLEDIYKLDVEDTPKDL